MRTTVARSIPTSLFLLALAATGSAIAARPVSDTSSAPATMTPAVPATPARPHTSSFDPHGKLDAETQIQIALQHKAEGRPQEALNTLGLAITSNAGNARLYAVRGSILLEQGRIKIDYQDPHSSAPDPNHMFPLMFQSLVSMLSRGRHSPTREYPRDQADEKFNAHWAAAAVFDVSQDFNTSHKQALVIAIHKSHLADAYSIFLFDEYEQVKRQIDDNLNSLEFLPD